MIYLSWSYVQLIVVIAFILIIAALSYKKKLAGKKSIATWAIASILLALYVAFDVGARQQDLGRSSFDSAPPSVVEGKVERKTLDRNDVKQTFEQAVKETK